MPSDSRQITTKPLCAALVGASSELSERPAAEESSCRPPFWDGRRQGQAVAPGPERQGVCGLMAALSDRPDAVCSVRLSQDGVHLLLISQSELKDCGGDAGKEVECTLPGCCTLPFLRLSSCLS